MKKLLFLGCFAILFFNPAEAVLGQGGAPQISFYYQEKDEREPTVNPSKYHLQVSTGLNNFGGMASLAFEYSHEEKFGIFAGGGLGSWGPKLGLGGRYYIHYPLGWSLNASLSRSTGFDEFIIPMNPQYLLNQNRIQDVNFTLKAMTLINVSATKYWNLYRKGKGRIFLELGYSFTTKLDDFYEADFTLSQDGHNFMEFIRPGGLILASGVSFGF